MKATRNSNGLYEISVTVNGSRKSKSLRGLVDTGSTDCVCTYKVITTLQIRPIDRRNVQSFDGKENRCLIYEAHVGFNGGSVQVPLIRHQGELAGDVDFILGMSVLEHCDVHLGTDCLTIQWSKR